MINLAIVSLFWLMLLCNLGVAYAFGLRLERAFATLLLAGCIVGLVFSPLLLARHWVDDFNRAFDVIILVAAWMAAMRSDRHWPLWFAGLQSLTVAMDIAAMTELGMRYRYIANLSALWALPAMLAMTAGILLDRRGDWSATGGSAHAA